MMYVNFKAGGRDYKLRLNTRNIIELERELNANPISIFGDGSTMPTFETMITVLHASLQAYEHNISKEDTYAIFDNYIDDGNSMTDFLNVIVELYRVSGIIPNKEEEAEKN